ncbi:uncharacterized protein METZ01_LOCUS81525 [marine metagenome]|uniref:Uncharacterized protein n=1 Tax=marine metagenome TaxID=408172 RepID=A0A381ULR5_9ZZZZ
MSRYRQTMAESLIQVWEGTKAGFGGAMTGDKGKAFQPRQLKDPKKEMMVFKKGHGVKVIDKSDWKIYKKNGFTQAEEVEESLNEDNMDLMKKAAKGSMQTIKFKDGKLKMDSFTASGIMAVFNKVNPKNKKAMEMMINNGTKAQIMKLQSLAMKATKEEVELNEASEKDILAALKKDNIGGYFSRGKLYVAQRALETARDILRSMKLKSMPSLVGEHKGNKPHKHPHPEKGPLAQVDEKFTMKDFKSNEDGNDHTQNAVELVKMFGDNYEKRQVAQIQKDHDKNRSISAKDQKVRDALVKKYLPKLKEDLDEKLDRDRLAQSFKVRYSAPTKDGNTFQVIDRDTKGMRGKQDDYKMVIVDKKGKVVKDWGSHVTVDGAVMFAKNKKIIEEVELDENVIVMGKGRVTKSVKPDAKNIKQLERDGWKIQGVIEKGSKILKKDAKAVMKAIKGGDKLGIGENIVKRVSDMINEKIVRDQTYFKSYSDAVSYALKYTKDRGYEVDEDDFHNKVTTGPRKPSEGKTVSQRIDVTKNGKPQKKQLSFQVYNKGGKNPYELNVYVESVSTPEIEAVWKAAAKNEDSGEESFEIGTDRYAKYVKDVTPGQQVEEGARADAMRGMRNDPLLGKRDEKEVDDTATDADIKAASKNIMFQLQNVIRLKGSAGDLKLTPSQKKSIASLGTGYAKRVGSGYVEFSTGKKEKVDPTVARAVWQKFQAIRRPIDKQKFQAKVSKSYKDMLKALKEGVEITEGTWHIAKNMSGLKKLMKKPIKAKDAEDKIAPFIGDDVLYDDFADLIKDDPNQDVRPTIKAAMKRLKIKEDVDLNEGRMKELHGYIQQKKSAEWIAKKMGVDVKTIKSLMSGYAETTENPILDRINSKIKERKYG